MPEFNVIVTELRRVRCRCVVSANNKEDAKYYAERGHGETTDIESETIETENAHVENDQ